MKKTKQFLLTFACAFVFALVFSSALIFVGCNHKHTYGQWQVVTEATHQTEGLRKRTCTKCGKEQTETIEKVAHTFTEWQTTLQATCSREGQESRSCECGKTETRTVAKLKHNFDEWEVTTPATCSPTELKNGVETRVCRTCQTSETREIQAAHHFVNESGLPATCTQDGYTDSRYCDVCGYEEVAKTILPATGHEYGNFTPNHDLEVNVHNGTHSKFCSKCGDEVKEPCLYDTQLHPATCEANGWNVHTCTICGDSFEHDQDSFPALGHAYPDDWTFVNEDGHYYHQKVCANDHSHILKADCSGESVVHEATCSAGGYTSTICDVCHGEFFTDPTSPLPHEFEGWTYIEKDGLDYHTHSCSECQFTESFRCENTTSVTPATCDSGTIVAYDCTICHNHRTETKNDQLQHVYSAWEHDPGSTEEDSKHTHQCVLCKKTETMPCVMVSSQQSPATCTASEVVENKCRDCGFSYEIEGGGATGHEFGPWSMATSGANGQHQHTCTKCHETQYDNCVFDFTVEEPNCVDAGTQTYTCRVEGCTNTYVVTLAALGHKYVEDGNSEDFNEWTITEDTHSRTCLRPNCGHVDTGAHVYNPSNFCASCGHDGLIYVEESNYYVVYSDNRVLTAKNIIIPERHRDLTTGKELEVRRIEKGYVNNKSASFLQNHTIETLEFPKTITSIGEYAFDYCSKLRSVKITGSDEEGFSSELVSIGAYAFQSCSSLREAHFPSNLQTIGNSAFSGCTSLETITIPDSVTEIGKYAFNRTKYLNTPTNWTNQAIYIGLHLIKVDPMYVGAFTVKAETKTISEEAFKDCTMLTKVTLPSSLTEIDADAFYGCTGLSEVEYDGDFDQWLGIYFANDHASPMNYATKLHIALASKDVVLHEGITSIPAGTFKGTEIESITLPNSLTTIGEEAFENCGSLTTINFGNDSHLSRIMANAFTNSKYYNTPSNWKNGILYVGGVVVKVSNDAGATPVFENEGHTIYGIAANAFEGNTVVTDLVLPASLIYIGKNALAGCKTLKTLKFLDAQRWFATTYMGVGRLLAEASLNGSDGGKSAAEHIVNIYTDEWIKNYSFPKD